MEEIIKAILGRLDQIEKRLRFPVRDDHPIINSFKFNDEQPKEDHENNL